VTPSRRRARLALAAAAAIPPGLYAFPAPPDWRGEEPTDARVAAWEHQFRVTAIGAVLAALAPQPA
jgi:hypothetical protein